MPLDFKMPALGTVLRSRIELERVLADTERKRGGASDIEVAAEFCRTWQAQVDRASARVFEVHSRSDRLTAFAFHHFNRKLPITSLRGRTPLTDGQTRAGDQRHKRGASANGKLLRIPHVRPFPYSLPHRIYRRGLTSASSVESPRVMPRRFLGHNSDDFVSACLAVK
jgi:hypothetical protein